MPKNLKPADEEAFREQINQETPKCPGCGSRLGITSIPPRKDVAYVRDRVLLNCSECEIKVVVDRK